VIVAISKGSRKAMLGISLLTDGSELFAVLVSLAKNFIDMRNTHGR
jgi:hypothetical protein